MNDDLLRLIEAQLEGFRRDFKFAFLTLMIFLIVVHYDALKAAFTVTG